jgi:4,5-epoxidase
MTCRRPDGTETTLHAAIAGTWVVLAGDQHDAARHTEAAAALLGADLVTTLAPARTSLRDVLVIRPDGHLAWRGRAAPEKLSAWLTQVLWPA